MESSPESPEVSSDCVSEEEKFLLPEPDPEQIAVLTNKLPDKPILPWNHYDSPWREEDEVTENVSVASELAGPESKDGEEDEVD